MKKKKCDHKNINTNKKHFSTHSFKNEAFNYGGLTQEKSNHVYSEHTSSSLLMVTVFLPQLFHLRLELNAPGDILVYLTVSC